MKGNFSFIQCLVAVLLLLSSSASAQNFDETWKEFLENNKISNMSALVKPDKRSELVNYAKYLLMNTNTDFCQSDVGDAEALIKEIRGLNPAAIQSVPGYVAKLEDLEVKVKAYHSIDKIWKRFLKTREVNVEELKGVEAATRLCEKGSLAKYSYMLAHDQLCLGEVTKAKSIFENRTLKLAQKTKWKYSDVEGLAPEVKNMSTLLKTLPKLDEAWKAYLSTGETEGFSEELPLFACNPVPNIKALVLNGVSEPCNQGTASLSKIEALQAESNVQFGKMVRRKIKELSGLVEDNDSNLATLNAAWEAFIPDNNVKNLPLYGHTYCTPEPLIRAYIMDGYTYVCELADDMLRKIDSLEQSMPEELDETTWAKINELKSLKQQYITNGEEIEEVWSFFVLNGDTLLQDYESRNKYCDHIPEVKDWTMRGLSADCDVALQYLEQIEEFNETFDFKFYEDLECRVQRLRIKVWDCRFTVLEEIARLESTPETYQARLSSIMEEYGMTERPAECEDQE